MKKQFILLVVAVIALSTFNSCKKCYTCSVSVPYSGTISNEYCKGSSESYKDFKNRIDQMESAGGYTCK